MDFEYGSAALTLGGIFQAAHDPRARVNTSDHTIQAEFSIPGDALIHKLEELMSQGYVRRIKIQNLEGYTLLAIPTDRNRPSGHICAFEVSEVTSARIIAAMVAQPRIVVEWQVSCPVSLPLLRTNHM